MTINTVVPMAEGRDSWLYLSFTLEAHNNLSILKATHVFLIKHLLPNLTLSILCFSVRSFLVPGYSSLEFIPHL